MSKGNALAGADRIKRPSVCVPEDLLDEFDEAVDAREDWDSRSDAVCQLMRDVVTGDMAADSGREEYRPYEPDLDELYQACLTHSNENLRLKMTAHGGRLARATGISKDDLGSALRPLRRKGFVSVLDGAPVVANPRRVYFVKPLAVNPAEWVRREQFE